MDQQAASRSNRTEIHPRNCWYALATSEEVGREPLGRRVLETGVVLFRTTDGIIKRWRRTEPQLLQLATHVSRRPQTEQTKRPEQPVPPPATVSTPTTNMRQLELF